MKEKDFPQFTILRSIGKFSVLGIIGKGQRSGFLGRFSDTKNVVGGIAYLLLPPDTFIKGRVSDLQASKKRATFAPADDESRKLLREGQTYTYFDGYWGVRAQLVLDRSRIWKRTAFAPSDAHVVSEHPQIWKKATPTPSDDIVEVVKGGWDHEHCEICFGRISQDENPYGYTDQEGEWICETCYEKYVVSRSLGFIYVKE